MFPFGFPASTRFADDRIERFREARAQLLVLADLQPRVERLVREPPVAVVGVRVGAVRVGEESQGVVEERPRPGVVLVVFAEALLDVGEPGSDAVLVTLQRRQVDGVSEVRRQQLVALGFEACSVGGEVGELLIPTGALLIERGIDFGGEVLVVILANRDGSVGVFDEPFGDLDGDGAAGAGGLLRGATGADEVGVGGAARVGGEVQ